MLTAEFEKYIQKTIDSRLNIRANPNATDIAGVYVGNDYIGVAVPPEKIYQLNKSTYVDATGYPYRNIKQAVEAIKIKLLKYESINDSH